jgi:penicillin G amidase
MPITRRIRIAVSLPMAFLALSLTSFAFGEPEILEVGGLTDRVEILRDRWGVSHIYAQNEADLFFAQGYNVARDRLFQLELWRRQATGTLAEIQGDRAIPHDVGSRLLRYRGDMADELSHYHSRGASIVGRFVDGINAYIEATDRDSSLLPIEFRVLGLKPGRWTPEVVVSRHNGLFRNVTAEVQAARLVEAIGEDRARELLHLHPGHPDLKPEPALDLSLVRDNVLANYKASRNAIRFRPDDVKPEYRGEPLAFLNDDESSVFDRPEMQGSNNWVVSGSRTASGKPIMANDPHRTIDLPSLRYWAHLSAPGWDVIGGGEPALPGVSIGHNQRGAWGFTIFPIDQEDLYVYETDPANPDHFQSMRSSVGWESMRVERETIAVKGKKPIEVVLKFTHHGPVIFEDRAKHKAYAVRAAWLEPGSAPYLASLRIDQAGNWAEFVEGCKSFRTPSENLVWADVDGNIGWQAVGLSPIRKGWDGLLPIPGDGRFEWRGFLAPSDLPSEFNPPRGWFASANQDNLPPGYPAAVGFQWSEPFRFRRISEVLEASRKVSLEEMKKLQLDELSLPARSLVPLLLKLKPGDERASRAIDRLKKWDFVLDKNSVPAAIEVMWERAVKAAVWERLVPKEARDAFPLRSLSPELMIACLTRPDSRFGPDPVVGRDGLLLAALDRALDELGNRLGTDMARWQFGQERFKHVWLPHPLGEAVKPDLRGRLDIAPRARGGSAQTVNSTSDSNNQASGASFRLIADISDWDRSIGTNTPGQSGDSSSRHYQDLFKPWTEGDYFPAAYSRNKVEAETEAKTLLIPGKSKN